MNPIMFGIWSSTKIKLGFINFIKNEIKSRFELRQKCHTRYMYILYCKKSEFSIDFTIESVIKLKAVYHKCRNGTEVDRKPTQPPQ
jgi:hypothetical protein